MNFNIKKNYNIILIIFIILGLIGWFWKNNLFSYFFTTLGFILSFYSLTQIRDIKFSINKYKTKEKLLKLIEIIDELTQKLETSKSKTSSENIGDNDGNYELINLKLGLRQLISELKPTLPIPFDDEIYEKLDIYSSENMRKLWKLRDFFAEYLETINTEED